MLTVDDFARIRLAHRDGMSVRELSRRFRWSRQAVRKALASPEPASYGPRQQVHAPKLGPFTAVIDQILAEDEKAPPKQRHFATRIFARLRTEHGYGGSYDQVRRYVRKHRRRQRELFVPLVFEPGQRVECDFGHIHVQFPDGRRLVPVFLATWAYSNHCFALALPSERTEAILLGMVSALEFFGCVPREIWWDNPTTVATAILEGRRRQLHDRYRALASHYNFEPLFCMPARGNEKPHVENRVKRLERHWATPVPSFADLAPLNRHLLECCQADRERKVQGKEQSIGQRFEEERARAAPLPRRAFDPCVSRPGMVDKYQTVRLDSNRYSAPRACAFQSVTIKAYPHEVVIVHGGQVVARHQRAAGQNQQVLDPLHYLVTLARKPALLDHGGAYRNWKLPPAFAELRQVLEERLGPAAGARGYIRVLQLLADHPAERIAEAIRLCQARGHLDPASIAQEICRGRDSASPASHPVDLSACVCAEVVRQTTSPLPDLTHFDQLFSQGELGHV